MLRHIPWRADSLHLRTKTDTATGKQTVGFRNSSGSGLLQPIPETGTKDNDKRFVDPSSSIQKRSADWHPTTIHHRLELSGRIDMYRSFSVFASM